MVRITPDLKNKMIEMRKGGSTYQQICDSLGVTKERCMAYLKDIELSPIYINAMTKEWQEAELEAKNILQKMGFSEIHDLNTIASVQSAWDYLCTKDSKYWLIDVTINGQKSISAKRDVSVDGYEHAILLKSDQKWVLIKIAMETLITL